MRKLSLFIGACAVISLLATAGVGKAQQPAKPGPEHEQLKQLEGIWEANASFGGQESKGTMTYKMDLGGMWLIGNFEGEFGGQKFAGRGMDSYDPMSKKYVSVWIDSMSARPMVSEGTFDAEKKTMTMTGEGPGQDGKTAKYKSVVEFKDKDSMTMTMYTFGADGKEQQMMTINYKRKG
jgi:hypothetical protein